MNPTLFLRLESFVVFIVAVTVYGLSGYNGWLFVILFFTPDVSAVGYIVSSKVGAFTYNLIHNFSLPIALLIIGYTFNLPLATAYGLIWTAHVGFDRTIGFGLNYQDRFGHTTIADIDVRGIVRKIVKK